jgi:hypothetical protein
VARTNIEIMSKRANKKLASSDKPAEKKANSKATASKS